MTGTRRSIAAGALVVMMAAGSVRMFAQDASGPTATGPDTASSSAAPPQAETTAFPARLSDVEGTVSITQAGERSNGTAPADAAQTGSGMPPAPPSDTVFRQALVNTPVMAGMTVQTGPDGRAEIQLPGGGMVRVAPDSDVTLVSLGESERVQAGSGLSYYELPNGESAALTVLSGPYSIQPAAGTLLRLDMDKAPYQAAVLIGTARVGDDAGDVSFDVPEGQTATLDPASAANYDLADGVQTSSWDQWNSDRDKAVAQMASGQTEARDGSGEQGDEAWNDLDYYGTWYNVPGAGAAWGPDGVDASFDPYGQGAWGYYSGVGYTWISAYPWGWLPYRSGGWSYYNNYGWLWRPGNRGTGWLPYAGVHRPPPGYRLPPTPSDLHLRTQGRGASAQPTGGAPSLSIVQRGPQFQFRSLGGARPEPRSFHLSGDGSDGGANASVPTLPIMPAGQYATTGRAGLAGVNRGLPGSTRGVPARGIYTPGPIPLPSRNAIITPSSRPIIAPPPRISLPSQRSSPSTGSGTRGR